MNSSSQIDHANSSGNKKIINKYYFLIGFIAISFAFAFIIGGFYFGKNESSKQQASTDINEQVKINTKELPNSPDDWKKYKLDSLGIELSLPEKLTKNNIWSEQVIPASEKGSIVCFSNEKSESAVCQGEILFAGGTSTDFQEGRGGTFTDLQGFNKQGSKYFIKTTGGNSYELKDAKFRMINNSNGVEIIKVLGENMTSQETEFPVGGTPGKGYLGAIINTNNSKYPGIAIQLKLDSDISEFEFDQILESIKTIN